MTQENKNRLLGLLQQHKELGIAEQIDFDKSMTDSLIANSVALVNSDDGTAIDDSERKWSIKPSLAEKMVDKEKTQRRISWPTFEELNSPIAIGKLSNIQIPFDSGQRKGINNDAIVIRQSQLTNIAKSINSQWSLVKF